MWGSWSAGLRILTLRGLQQAEGTKTAAAANAKQTEERNAAEAEEQDGLTPIHEQQADLTPTHSQQAEGTKAAAAKPYTMHPVLTLRGSDSEGF